MEQDYSAICRPREQESCFAEARIFLLSAKAKARLVAGCSSGKYLTGACATVFSSRGKSSRGNGGAKEQAQRDGQAEKAEGSKVDRGVDGGIGDLGAQEASGRVSGTCVDK